MEALQGKFLKKTSAVTYCFGFDAYGWAHFTLNDETGEFIIQSDWGDYSYRWPEAGLRGTPVSEFIATCHPDYIARKFSYSKPRSFRQRFDAEATQVSFKEEIIRKRREGDLTETQARSCWDEIVHLFRVYVADYSDHEAQSLMVMEHFPHDLLGIDDLAEWLCYRPSQEYEFLVKKLLPFFIEWLKGEGK